MAMPESKYRPYLHSSSVDGLLMFLSETDGARVLLSMKLLRPTDVAKNRQ